MVFLRNIAVTEYQDYYITDGTHHIEYIPKKIFQLIADKNKVNPSFQKNIEYIKNLNPDWEYNLYDDSDIITYMTAYYPDMLYYYNKINPRYGAARADFFRYLLMYREGGVYLDIKSAMKFPLNRIIFPKDEYILSYWNCPCKKMSLDNEMGEFQQWHIICRPKHPFLRAVIQNVIKNIEDYRLSDGIGKEGVLKVTGPVAYSKSIMPLVSQYNCRIIDTNEMIGLIYNNLPKSYNPFSDSHIGLFSNTHYSKIREPIIINNN
jgi:hypothetical protein